MFASVAIAVSLALASGTAPSRETGPEPPAAEVPEPDARAPGPAPEEPEPDARAPGPAAEVPEPNASEEPEPDARAPGPAPAEPDAGSPAPALLDPTTPPSPSPTPPDATEPDDDPFGDEADTEPFVDDDPFGDEADPEPFVDDDPFGDAADPDGWEEDATEGSGADSTPLPAYDPTRDSPEAVRARHWVRTGIVSLSAGTALLVGAIIMATSDPCGRNAGNSCQHVARNRAATVMAVPAGAMIAGGVVALGVGVSRRNALRLELQAHRRGGWIGVRGRF